MPAVFVIPRFNDMPIYAFRCSSCAHGFDRLQKLSDPDPDACPACGTRGEVSRQLTAPSFRLAGSGWYETDFKKEGDKRRNLAEGGEGAGQVGDKPAGEAPAQAGATPAAPAVAATPKPANATPSAS